MRWLVPEAALLRKAKLAHSLVGAGLIALALIWPILPRLLEKETPPFGYMVSIQVLLLAMGSWAYLFARSLDYRIALAEEGLWIRYKDKLPVRLAQDEILTDGKTLLAGSLWLPLGVKFKLRPWTAFYRPDALSELVSRFRRVDTLALFWAGLKRTSPVCWAQLGMWVALLASVALGIWLCSLAGARC